MADLEFKLPLNADAVASKVLKDMLGAIEDHTGKDVIALYGPIRPGVDGGIREAIERLEGHTNAVLIIVNTLGGVVEIVERIVNTVRNRYDVVHFVVPDRAMSAGTILVLSGDAVFMDTFSLLGPIDPQIESPDRENFYISGLTYLDQYEALKHKGGNITKAEEILLQKLDLGMLESYRLANELTVELLQEWLVKYKFKDWKKKETRKTTVTDEDRRERAREIAEALNDHRRWGSHGRGINSRILQDELNLKIEDLEADPKLWGLIRDYYWFSVDYCNRHRFSNFVQSRALL